MTRARRFVVAGGSGLIGRRLVEAWLADGAEVTVLSRSAEPEGLPAGAAVARWDGRTLGAWAERIGGAEAVVNLCGANLAAGRWSEARKRLLRTSRIEPTRALVEAIGRAAERPRVLLQASAVGLYGDRGEEALSEHADPGSGFLPQLCREWEAASAEVESLGVRRVLLRSGIVLSREGGALAKMLPAFRLGLGAPLGDGAQYFPWIHRDDEIEAVRFLAASPTVRGPFNLAAPEERTNREFTRELARACRRPVFFPVPRVVLRALFGEMGDVLLQSQRAVPTRLAEAGYGFRYPELAAALAELLGRPR